MRLIIRRDKKIILFFLMPLFILAIFLTAFIGFSAHRASLCSVSAVEEIISTRRAYMLTSFLKASIWVTGIALIFTEIFSLTPVQTDGWELSPKSVIGGLMFGIGAALNRGCAVSTLTRLGSGNVGKILTLVGFFAGALAFDLLKVQGLVVMPLPVQTILDQQNDWKIWFMLGVTLWMFWEVIRLIRSQLHHSILKNLLAPRYKLSSAAFVIGTCNGVLFFTYGIWMHTRLLGETVRYLVLDAPTPDTFLWVLFGSLLVGITLSAVHSRRFSFKWRPESKWFLYSGGGIFMGFGGAMIPGGNDVIWLNALPSMSLHAIPALLSMLAGIALTLFTLRTIGQDIQHVDCHGDLCKIIDKS
jgi:uncharacterized membrane protein YedE/YeeE